jgi:hypothetical protein
MTFELAMIFILAIVIAVLSAVVCSLVVRVKALEGEDEHYH